MPAPRISSVRLYVSPRRLMPSNCAFPPVPTCFGTRPSLAANFSPDLKAFASLVVPTEAVAVSRPTRGIPAIALDAILFDWHLQTSSAVY